jgi:hypothetical protein
MRPAIIKGFVGGAIIGLIPQILLLINAFGHAIVDPFNPAAQRAVWSDQLFIMIVLLVLVTFPSAVMGALITNFVSSRINRQRRRRQKHRYA